MVRVVRVMVVRSVLLAQREDGLLPVSHLSLTDRAASVMPSVFFIWPLLIVAAGSGVATRTRRF